MMGKRSPPAITSTAESINAELVGSDGSLSYLTKSDVHYTVEIDFDKEVGNEKGSWKGGTLGVTVTMQDDETPEQAIARWIQEERAKDNQHTRHRIDLMLKSWGTTKENQQ